MIVYLIQFPNCKGYIGRTKWTLALRKKQHESRLKTGRYNLALYNAFRKYGMKNTRWRVLDTANDIDQLISKEKHWIRALRTLAPHGYNMTDHSKGSIYAGERRTSLSMGRKRRFEETQKKAELAVDYIQRGGKVEDAKKIFGISVCIIYKQRDKMGIDYFDKISSRGLCKQKYQECKKLVLSGMKPAHAMRKVGLAERTYYEHRKREHY